MEARATKLLLVVGCEAGGGQRPGAGDLKHGERVKTEGHTSSNSEGRDYQIGQQNDFYNNNQIF